MISLGDGYRARKDLGVTVVVLWDDAEPTVYDGVLPAGEVFAVAEEPAPGETKADIDPAGYPELEERLVPAGDRSAKGYRGFFLRIPLDDIYRHCEVVPHSELADHIRFYGIGKPTIMHRLVWAAFGIPMLLTSGFLLVICVMVAAASFFDPLHSQWDWVWAVPGAFVMFYAVGWCVRLILARPRADGGLFSPQWLAGLGIFFSLLPFAAIAMDLTDGKLHNPGALLAAASVLYAVYRWYSRTVRERRALLARNEMKQS
ncbi:hypothetical protein ABI59_00250 [Acidobacteria bacterium Mor1]|nr:hypothetical protein ABI59_00250 [Acidobacteria bacterium Mor1]